MIKHDGNCTIYESLHQSDGLPWSGVCTCGAGFREANRLMHSDEISGGRLFLEGMLKHVLSTERLEAYKSTKTDEDRDICRAIIAKMCGCDVFAEKELEALTRIVPRGAGLSI